MSNKNKQVTQKMSIPNDIAQLANNIFGNSVKAEEWLSTPIRALNGDSPFMRLNTDEGVDEVRAIMHKIECGEFP